MPAVGGTKNISYIKRKESCDQETYAMKEMVKKLIEEMNRSEELTEEPIMTLASCFKDADSSMEEGLILELEQAVSRIFTCDRVREFDQRFISGHMAELLAAYGTAKPCKNLGTYHLEGEEGKCCILQLLCLELGDGSEICVANAREGSV